MVRATIGWLLTNRIFTPRRRHRTDSWAHTAYAHDPMKSRSRMSMTNGPGAMAIAALLLPGWTHSMLPRPFDNGRQARAD